MQSHHAPGEPQRSPCQRNQDSFGEHLAQNRPSSGAERQSQRRFLRSIRGSCRKQAPQVCARRQQNKPRQHHQACHERPRRSAEHVAHQPWTSQREFHARVGSWISFGEPSRQRIQIRCRLRRRHSRPQPSHHKGGMIATLLQFVVALDGGLLDHRNPHRRRKEQLCAPKRRRRHADDRELVLVDLAPAAPPHPHRHGNGHASTRSSTRHTERCSSRAHRRREKNAPDMAECPERRSSFRWRDTAMRSTDSPPVSTPTWPKMSNNTMLSNVRFRSRRSR